MEFLVEFEVNPPEGTPASVLMDSAQAEAAAAAQLAEQGHLRRLWNVPNVPGGAAIVGLYQADTLAQLDSTLSSLPLYRWMQMSVTPLEPHPNDPERGRALRDLNRS